MIDFSSYPQKMVFQLSYTVVHDCGKVLEKVKK